jgi:thioredoxin-like negative regulator of GroEL
MALLAQERAGKFVVAKVNTDEATGLARRYRIASIPTLILFKHGGEADRESGAMPRAAIIKRFGI